MRIGPFGVWEILIILIVVLLIFGPRRLPEMAKGLGQSVREFRKEMRSFKEDMDIDGDDRPPKPASARTEKSAPATSEAEPERVDAPAAPVVKEASEERDTKPV
jgi:sec-independent protein translocase protein TatA